MSRVSFSPPAPAPLPPLLSLPARKMRLGNGEERCLFLMHHRAEIPSLSFVLFTSRPSSLPSSSISHFRFGLLFSFSPLSRLFLFSFLPPLVFAPPGSRRDGGGPAGDGAPGAPAREINSSALTVHYELLKPSANETPTEKQQREKTNEAISKVLNQRAQLQKDAEKFKTRQDETLSEAEARALEYKRRFNSPQSRQR